MRSSARVALVAIPLMARSGVYRTSHDLVRAAQAEGLCWRAVLGMRPHVSGEPLSTEGVRELAFDARGRAGLGAIARLLEAAPEVQEADVVISLITQSDVAIAKNRRRLARPWVAWVRGKPWPAPGEQSAVRRLLLRTMETRALRAADDVWATTPILASEFATARRASIVPAGISAVPRLSHGSDGESPIVWAGRVDIDKRPDLFLEIVRAVGHPGRLHGAGPLEATLRDSDADVTWAGWTSPADLWRDVSVFVGTSSREAFGRSAVEAAASGVPVVLGAAYGAAPLLFTDSALRAVCVIDSDDPRDWAAAVRRLLDDRELRKAVSNHVHANAQALTIEASVASAATHIERLMAAVRS